MMATNRSFYGEKKNMRTEWNNLPDVTIKAAMFVIVNDQTRSRLDYNLKIKDWEFTERKTSP